ncbi:hypothetical protein CH35J_002967 [Colletotrichum higginsianum]|uniref:BTB domain-containing protein n=1 Tax=Colletotrichum higginsianum TaxID=80884 RepID=A0A4T0WD58_9PEZI|nr:hypothetical protein CH35J_002967 [Colletotrichum higginsianum]
MAPLSWAQVAAKNHKPSPIRHQIADDGSSQAQNPPCTIPTKAAESPCLTANQNSPRAEQKSPEPSASRSESSHSCSSGPVSVGKATEESGLALSTSKIESSPLSSATSSVSSRSPTLIFEEATTPDGASDEMANARRDRRAARKAAEEAARQARLSPTLEAVASVTSVPSASAFSAPGESSAKSEVAIAASVPLPVDEDDDEKNDEVAEQETSITLVSGDEGVGPADSTHGDSDHRRVFRASLESGQLPRFERTRRVRLFYATPTYDCAIALSDGKVVSGHRDIITSESTYLAQNLPPANEVGVTHYEMDGYSVHVMGVMFFWIYMGELGGHVPDKSNLWSTHYILNNVMYYRPAMLLGIKTLRKYQVGNVLKACDFWKEALNGRFFYFKFADSKKLASFEIPLRMAHIHLYTENMEEEYADEIRQMKIALAKVTLIVLPFLRRQFWFVAHVQKLWETLAFPWRSEMEDLYHDGLLPDFPTCFDENLQWVEEKIDSDRYPVPDGNPSSSGMPYSQASINEMTRRLTMAGYDSGYHL